MEGTGKGHGQTCTLPGPVAQGFCSGAFWAVLDPEAGLWGAKSVHCPRKELPGVQGMVKSPHRGSAVQRNWAFSQEGCTYSHLPQKKYCHKLARPRQDVGLGPHPRQPLHPALRRHQWRGTPPHTPWGTAHIPSRTR